MGIKFSSPKINKTGLPPGSMVYTGEQKVDTVRMTRVDYTQQTLQEQEVDVQKALSPVALPGITWLKVAGLHDIPVLERIRQDFNIHSLVMEDILNTGQRPKIEIFDDHLFMTLKMLSYSEQQDLVVDQISLILGPNYVLTFQEQSWEVFDVIRERIENEKSRIRKSGADYLAYALLDVLIDHYFLILDNVGDRLERLDGLIMETTNREVVLEIQNIKRELAILRRSVWPLREVINGLTRKESEFIQEGTMPYIRDLYDHVIQVLDMVESYRDMVGGLLDIYLSTLSHRLNEVMKVLTIMATIFIPLTFIVGVYGMNFEFMPELQWRWAYPTVWGLIVTVFLGMLLYFKRRRWL